MSDYNYKIERELFPKIDHIKNIKILELGVQTGRSTLKFLDLCKVNNGHLYSVDINDCSNVSKDKNWKFIQSRDDNLELIKREIPDRLDVIFIDTTHEANHVERVIYNYYDLLKKGGYLFIDDISHLPYQKGSQRNKFYCEINNKETFERILEIYNNNSKNFDLNFSFISSGMAIIQKKTNEKLSNKSKVISRENSLKNIFRKLWKKVKS